MEARDTLLYFAYGSNMYSPRLRARVPSASFVDVARLTGHYLSFRKRGRDGSAKCDLEPLDTETVWGVVYRIDAAELGALDAAEGEGYRREPVTVATATRRLDAFTYRARPDWYTGSLPYDWYRDLVAAGAREHGLPELYTAAVAGWPVESDPDPERAARNRPAGG